jgi:4a-hydroxytetrahydrobiopterin dehydratase
MIDSDKQPTATLVRQKLSDDQIRSELASLSGWARNGDEITRTFSFPRFADGIAFVQRVASAADKADHHPDIDIRYTKIRIALSTHDAGGITAADVKLAKEIQKLSSAP